MKEITLNFKLNGRKVRKRVPVNMTLTEIIREKFGLTGTKYGCGKGECGACTVIINGRSMDSCLVMAPQVNGKNVITIEGLSKGNRIDPLQKAFIEEGAIQCGYCTPGMVMSAKALLKRNPKPAEYEIKRGIAGNLCRCTGYTKIIKAVKKAAKNR